MKKYLLLFLGTVLFFTDGYSQNVGINDDGSTPDASAMLDVKSANKGLLVPRVALTGTGDAVTIPSPAVSLLVYNTATTAGSTAIKPGYYSWNGTAWIMFNTGASWNLGGNSGTVDPINNFIGTTDDVSLNFRVNNINAGRIDDNWANTFLGFQSGNSISLGKYNSAVGAQALLSNTTGSWNVAIGISALKLNTTGYANTANGSFALQSNTTGPKNVANGEYALSSNTTGNSNTAIGASSLQNNVDGSFNTATGVESIYSNTTGSNNTANGYRSFYTNTTGINNISVGAYSMYFNTTGNGNTAIGYQALANNHTGANNTALGYGASVSQTDFTNTIAIGYNTMITNSNTAQIGNYDITDVTLGDPSNTILHCGAVQTPSDARFKYNIKSNVPGLDFITKLTPVTYYFDGQKLEEFTKTGILTNSNMHPVSYSGEKQLHTGFLAQDVEKAAKELNYNFDGVHTPSNDKDHYSLAYSQFVVPLVKAVQEQEQQIEKQQNVIELLQGQVAQLTKAVKALTDK